MINKDVSQQAFDKASEVEVRVNTIENLKNDTIVINFDKEAIVVNVNNLNNNKKK